MKALLLSALLSLVLVAGGLVTYDRLVAQPARLVGVVDVAEVYRAKESEFTLLLTNSPSEEERQKALLMARAFAQRLPLALEQLPRECGCMVILKSAVAGASAHTVDLTPLLRRKVDAP